MDLKFLNEKMKDELDIKDAPEVDDVDHEEEDDDDVVDNTSKSRVRIETDSKIVGIIKNVSYDLKYKDLADRLTDEIPGVSITRDKAKKIFKVVKDMVGF